MARLSDLVRSGKAALQDKNRLKQGRDESTFSSPSKSEAPNSPTLQNFPILGQIYQEVGTVASVVDQIRQIFEFIQSRTTAPLMPKTTKQPAPQETAPSQEQHAGGSPQTTAPAQATPAQPPPRAESAPAASATQLETRTVASVVDQIKHISDFIQSRAISPPTPKATKQPTPHGTAPSQEQLADGSPQTTAPAHAAPAQPPPQAESAPAASATQPGTGTVPEAARTPPYLGRLIDTIGTESREEIGQSPTRHFGRALALLLLAVFVIASLYWLIGFTERAMNSESALANSDSRPVELPNTPDTESQALRPDTSTLGVPGTITREGSPAIAVAPPPEVTKITSPVTQGSYYLHTSSHASNYSARSALNRLTSKGLRGLIREVHIAEKGPYIRVLIGPYETRLKAQRQGKEIRSKGWASYTTTVNLSRPR